MIAEILHGKDSPTSGAVIADMYGWEDTSFVRAVVERERRDGAPIGAGNAGYYLCVTSEELERYLKGFSDRLNSMASTYIAMKKTAERMRREEAKRAEREGNEACI